MPNLVPPVTCAQQAVDYRQQIMQHVPEGTSFEPLMTLYLTNDTTAEDVEAAKGSGIVAFKLYPAGATTNSASGVTDISECLPALQAMAKVNLDIPVFVRKRLQTCLLHQTLCCSVGELCISSVLLVMVVPQVSIASINYTFSISLELVDRAQSIYVC